MPSGPKKRRAANRKKRSGTILDAKEEHKLQDYAAGKTSTRLVESDIAAENEIESVVPDTILSKNEAEEVNLLVQLLAENANQEISFEGVKDETAKHVFASSDFPSSLMSNEEVVPDSQATDNLEEADDVDDSNPITGSANLTSENAGGGLTSQADEEILPDVPEEIMELLIKQYSELVLSHLPHHGGCLVVDPPIAADTLYGSEVADNVMDQETKEAVTDSCFEEFPVDDGKVASPLPKSDVPTEKENGVEDKKEVEKQEKMKAIDEAVWKTKKTVEQQLEALYEFEQVLLGTLLYLNSITINQAS